MKSEPPDTRPHHPVVLQHEAQRAANIQLRIADAIAGTGLLAFGCALASHAA